MRKLIFFVVLLCMVGYSQVIQYRDTNYTGNQQFRTVMPTQPLPVKDSTLTGLYPNATGSSSTTYSRVDTAATTSDSVSTSFISSYFDILNNGSVAIYFCTDIAFGDNKIVVPAYASYRWSVRTTRIHYKTLTSTAEVYIIAQ